MESSSKVSEEKCKHEWRQALRWGYQSNRDDGYYCIHCLARVNSRKGLDKLE